jgi:hypothetical protein
MRREENDAPRVGAEGKSGAPDDLPGGPHIGNESLPGT